MKKCKQGYYYCYDEKKCKKIPNGYRVGLGGWLRKEKEEEKSEESTETKKNGNGTNGNGSNGSNGDGGAVSEGWSEKYKKSIDCKNPKGFSQRAHCQGKKKVEEAKNYEKGDHEVSMAKKQVEKSADNLKKLAKVLAKKTDKDNLPAWVQAKITNAEHDTDAASSYMEQACPICNEDPCQCLEGTVTEGKRDGKSAKDKDYSLRDWFKGGGWVQAGGKYDGKPCAKQPGQKTKPFCRDADDRAAMSKDEREKRAKKKRKEDPNPNRKGKAKMVTAEAYDTRGTKYDEKFDDAFKKAVEGAGGKSKDIHKLKSQLQKAHFEPEGEVVSEKKDACYKKVKARYDVWPSAYASGALVKCRKVGAANWGNKTKKEGYEFSNWRDDFQPIEIETTDLIKPEPLVVNEYKEGDKVEYSKKTQELIDRANETPIQNLTRRAEQTKKSIQLKAPRNPLTLPEAKNDPCWVGYKQVGMKKKGGKMVPNCVKEGCSNWREELSEDWQKVNKKDKTDGMSQKAVDAYKRENPGSKLKTAVTEKNPGGKRAKRRKSFCARSNGQRKMHNIDCSKTPDKAICKARKRWRC